MTIFRSRVRDKLVQHYPDLRPLRRATRAGNWQAVVSFFDALPRRADRAVAAEAVATTPGAERFLQRIVDTQRDSALARTLFGTRLIILAWQARSRKQAQYVSAAQFQAFHEHLLHAERVLSDATAIDPGDTAAWTARIKTARGLSISLTEARRRYDKAAEHCDAPHTAQAAMVQNLCPKWGGSLPQMHAFARECLSEGKPATLSGAVVADAHVEHVMTIDSPHQQLDYLVDNGVAEQLRAAAAQTVLHPQFEPCHGEVAAHSAFAFVFYVGWNNADAAKHFAALRGRVASYPWHMTAQNWQAAVRNARRRARKS